MILRKYTSDLGIEYYHIPFDTGVFNNINVPFPEEFIDYVPDLIFEQLRFDLLFNCPLPAGISLRKLVYFVSPTIQLYCTLPFQPGTEQFLQLIQEVSEDDRFARFRVVGEIIKHNKLELLINKEHGQS